MRSELPIKSMSWWRVVALPAGAYTPMSFFLIIVLPPFEPGVIKLAGGLVLLGVALFVLAKIRMFWWIVYAMLGILSVQFLLIAIRAWLINIQPSLLWIGPLVAMFALSWALPMVSPALSNVLYREATAPKTRLGQVLLTVFLSIGGGAGAIGAVLGMSGGSVNGVSIPALMMAVIMTLVAIGSGQLFCHQLVAQRPPPFLKGDRRATLRPD